MKIPSKLEEQGFRFEKRYGEGGKSFTALVSKDDFKALLKLPATTDLSREQQFRFRKEAEALQLLNGRGAPKVCEYDFEGDEPFILMEFIKGTTLTDFVGGKPIEIDLALDLLFKILEIVGEIHDIDLLHRDIKPDNVMVNSEGDVFLIDFGLCRTVSPEEESYKTPAGAELGNRFLRLPEFSKGAKVTSSASDITFCIGLLFYMLSGKAPNQLRDERNEPPHRRRILTDELENTKWITYVFDRGFAFELSKRFQNACQVREFIEDMRKLDEIDVEDNAAEEFSRFIASDDFQRRDRVHQLVMTAHRRFIGAAEGTLNGDLASAGSGPNATPDGRTIVTDFLILKRKESSPASQYGITSEINEDLNQVSFTCSTNKSVLYEGFHFLSEESRILDDYSNMGTKCGRIAIRNLIERLKFR